MHFPWIATVVVAASLMVGCRTLGNKFDPALVDRLTPGVSSSIDATQLLGKPTSETNNADGSQLLQWAYVQSSPIGAKSARVAVLFDKDGKMIRVAHRGGTEVR
jgi:hypothetical protein